MIEVSDKELARAAAAGKRLSRLEPRAASARYDAGSRMIVVALRNGCTFSFPASLGQGLEHASDAELAEVRVEGEGYGLHWAALDVDLAVPGLLAGRFGSEKHMARLAGAAAVTRRGKQQAA